MYLQHQQQPEFLVKATKYVNKDAIFASFFSFFLLLSYENDQIVQVKFKNLKCCPIVDYKHVKLHNRKYGINFGLVMNEQPYKYCFFELLN